MKAKAKTAWLFNVLRVASFREEDEARLFRRQRVASSASCAFASGSLTLK